MQFQKYVFLCMNRSEKGWQKWPHQGFSLITVILPWHGDLFYLRHTSSKDGGGNKERKFFSFM